MIDMNTEVIYQYLERIANLLRTETRRSMVEKGLQPVQLEALNYLSHCNRYSNTPAAVADFLGLTKGTVSQTLGLLENVGLIEKLPDYKDRRVVHLQLTARGIKVIAETIPPTTLQAALAQMPEAEQVSVLDALDKMLKAMQGANQLRTFGVCKTCRHHRIETDGQHRCALTGEILRVEDIDKICREHETPELPNSLTAGF
jgi:DNA-binding MarR family transcriptional regulator